MVAMSEISFSFAEFRETIPPEKYFDCRETFEIKNPLYKFQKNFRNLVLFARNSFGFPICSCHNHSRAADPKAFSTNPDTGMDIYGSGPSCM